MRPYIILNCTSCDSNGKAWQLQLSQAIVMTALVNRWWVWPMGCSPCQWCLMNFRVQLRCREKRLLHYPLHLPQPLLQPRSSMKFEGTPSRALWNIGDHDDHDEQWCNNLKPCTVTQASSLIDTSMESLDYQLQARHLLNSDNPPTATLADGWPCILYIHQDASPLTCTEIYHTTGRKLIS